MAVARVWWVVNWGDADQRIQTCDEKKINFGDMTHSIVIAVNNVWCDILCTCSETVSYIFSPQKEMIIMICKGGVIYCYDGNHIAIY